jgi:hypothetical protein
VVRHRVAEARRDERPGYDRADRVVRDPARVVAARPFDPLVVDLGLSEPIVERGARADAEGRDRVGSGGHWIEDERRLRELAEAAAQGGELLDAARGGEHREARDVPGIVDVTGLVERGERPAVEDLGLRLARALGEPGDARELRCRREGPARRGVRAGGEHDRVTDTLREHDAGHRNDRDAM